VDESLAKPYDMVQFGSACDDVRVFGESPDDEDDVESNSDLNTRLEMVFVLRDERQVEEEAIRSERSAYDAKVI
jgi:hypothetical protein